LPPLVPHNGLFIPRAPEFGRRTEIGFADLVDRGVLPEQDVVRFDDFISLDSSSVPRPQPPHAMAASFGLTPIPEHLRRDPRSTHYLEIALASSKESWNEAKSKSHTPANYVFVVDRSGSMMGAKIDTARAAVRNLIAALDPGDVVGIVEFNENVQTALKAQKAGEIQPADLGRALRLLTASGGTDIALGVKFGIDELSRFGGAQRANRIFFFSDGQPTSGETSWDKIRLDIERRVRELPAAIYTFGIGPDADNSELERLAGTGRGSHTEVIEPRDIASTLLAENTRRKALVARNIQVKITVDPAVNIVHFYGHDLVDEPTKRQAILEEVSRIARQAEKDAGVKRRADIVSEEDGVRVFIPDLAPDETYILLLEVGLPAKGASPVGSTVINYIDTIAGENASIALTLNKDGALGAEVTKQHAFELQTSEVVFQALNDLRQKDRDLASRRVQSHLNRTKLYAGDTSDAGTRTIRSDIVTLRKFVSLFENLGKPISSSDGAKVTAGLSRALTEFGAVKSGFTMNAYFYQSTFVPRQ
jgi:hypothetical protein